MNKINVGDRVRWTTEADQVVEGVVLKKGTFNFGQHGKRQGVKVEVRTKKFLATHRNKVVMKRVVAVKVVKSRVTEII